jgi:hypothetical protein
MQVPVMELWNGRDPTQAYEWLGGELANLRAAFHWAVQEDDLDTGATIAVFAALLSATSGSSAEPITWAEQLLPAATQARHRLLVALYQAAAGCAWCGRPDDAMAYEVAARALYGDPTFEQNIYGIAAHLASATYMYAPRLDRWVSACREVLAVANDPLLLGRSLLADALAITGHAEQALTVCDGLVPAAAATGNPWAHGVALIALGHAQAETDPATAVVTTRECVELLRHSGMPRMETAAYLDLAHLEMATGQCRPALDLLRDTTRWHFDAGDFSTLTASLALISALLTRCDLPEPAATIAGVATTPFTLAAYPEFAAAVEQLPHTLGEEDFDRLSQQGRAMPRPKMAVYALQAIEEARTRLDQLDPQPRGG